MGGPRSALVTGASRGLGYELTRLLAGRGWVVHPLCRTREQADRLASVLPPVCRPVVADVTDAAAGESVRAALADRGPALDLLVNNAGVFGAGSTLSAVRPEEVADLLNVHCLGALRCTQAAAPFLRVGRAPAVVNVSSRFGSVPRNLAGEFLPLNVSYSYRIAKAAQNMLTVCLSLEPGLKGVTVCAVHPGRFATGKLVANQTAPEAASRVADWIEQITPAFNGTFHDLDAGTVGW
jgi:NAD(P)-dependent dehydrogenase (short-subunit alcohol dehydrogenase family)